MSRAAGGYDGCGCFCIGFWFVLVRGLKHGFALQCTLAVHFIVSSNLFNPSFSHLVLVMNMARNGNVFGLVVLGGVKADLDALGLYVDEEAGAFDRYSP